MRCLQLECVGCFVVAALLASTGVAKAELLKVDFNREGNTGVDYDQPGFSVFEVPRDKDPVDASQTFGDYTVHVQAAGAGNQYVGGYANAEIPDSGAFTFGNLYRDVAYTNFGESLTVSVSGLTGNTSYDLKLYAFDTYAALGNVVNTFTPAPGTIGDPVAVNYNAGVAPTSNDEYAVTARWQSNNTGVISFTVTGLTEDTTYAQSARLTGLTISEVPEPGSVALLALGFVGLLAFPWRKRM